ncbi:DUF7878 domain-containing protein [Amycolatopsis nivea]
MHNEAKSLKLSFSGLAAPDLDGRSRTEVFVNVEADLTVLDGGREILRAGAFPVVELASALRAWKARPSDDRGDFTFTSLSLEGHWRLRLLRSTEGWQVVDDGDPDAFTDAPHPAVLTGVPRSAAEVDAAIDEFATRLRGDCIRLFGPWIEPYFD